MKVINPAQESRRPLKIHRVCRKQYPATGAITKRHLHFEITNTTIHAKQFQKLIIDFSPREKRCSLAADKTFRTRSDHLDAMPRRVADYALSPRNKQSSDGT